MTFVEEKGPRIESNTDTEGPEIERHYRSGMIVPSDEYEFVNRVIRISNEPDIVQIDNIEVNFTRIIQEVKKNKSHTIASNSSKEYWACNEHILNNGGRVITWDSDYYNTDEIVIFPDTIEILKYHAKIRGLDIYVRENSLNSRRDRLTYWIAQPLFG